MARSTIARTVGIGILFCLVSTGAGAAEFQVVPGASSSVRFESKAPLESFEGRTREVSGRIRCTPGNLADSLSAWFEVDLRTLDTGISLRNKHMRENHLHTDLHPRARFRFLAMEDRSAFALRTDLAATATAIGEFDLHGVQRTIEVPVEMRLLPMERGTALHILARFPVRLSDHEIPRPQFLALKLDEVQRVTVELLAEPVE